ncbi:hypothetical protein [uncultured Olleya sp.]|uniref:hypothetical protein n=1 Tax=uncultured Olleya sp. TaxID=757243 RepID=UPI002595E145|nr:hypothetical protein [uncultured Olleya sp.]
MDIKKYIITGLISGLVFAILLAGWDYYKQNPFSVLKFVIHTVIFGVFNGYMTYRKAKNVN